MTRDREKCINAFRKARIEGEKLLSQGKITWEEFCFVMLGFEQKLRDSGVHL